MIIIKSINDLIVVLNKNLNEIDNSKNKNNFDENLFFIFLNKFSDSLSKSKELFTEFSNVMIEPINIYHNNLTKIYANFLDDFNNLSKDIFENNKILLSKKNEYFEICRILENLKESNEKDENKIKINKIEIQKEKILKEYKYEHNKFNLFLDNKNLFYIELYEKYYKNEEGRIIFLKENFNKSLNYLLKFNNITNEFVENFQKILNKIIIEDEIKNLKQNLSFYHCGERFLKFKLELFDNNKINLFEDDFEIINNNNDIEEKTLSKETSFLEKFIELIFSKKKIEKKYLKAFEFLIKDEEFYSLFFDKLMKNKNNKEFFIIKNKNNFLILSNNIFKQLIYNYKNKEEINLLFDKLINFSEQTFLNENNHSKNKVYLCALISNNFLRFKDLNFWRKLLEINLGRKLEEHIEHLNKINLTEKKNENNNNSNENKNKFFNIFFKKKKEQTTTIKSNSLIEEIGMNKFIRNYNKIIDSEKKIILDNFCIKEFYLILENFIIHLNNFNNSKGNIIQFILELCNKFKIKKEKINYFVVFASVWEFSIKKFLPNDKKIKVKLNEKIIEIKQKKFDLINIKYPLYLNVKNERTKFEQINFILIESSKFLNLNDLMKIFLLNKNVYSKIKNKIYKIYLNRKNISFNERLKIWNNILNINKIKKEFNYEIIKEEIKIPENLLKINKKNLEIVNLDLKRTYFEIDEEKNRNILNNIITSMIYSYENLNYFQGLHMLTNFIFQILGNEKETFYLLMGIVKNTEFTKIFLKDLNELKILFKIFERLINIFIPEIYTFLKLNNVKVEFFCAPWFVTLFSNSCQKVDNKNLPLIVLKILDNFFIKGWRVIINVGLILLKMNEEKIFGLNYENILQFLINNILKTEFFENSFVDKFDDLIQEFKIPKKLIKDLELEIEYEKKI